MDNRVLDRGKDMTDAQCPVCKIPMTGQNIRRHQEGTNCWGDSVPILNEETEAVWTYWKQKRRLGKRNTIPFLLSPTELIELLNDAGITAKDIGQALHQYALARYNDTGNYEVGNCRFITVKENIAERKLPGTLVKTLCHPHRRTTHTPNGTYNSLNEAARAYGVGHKTIAYRINSTTEKMKEYYYA